jgi:hypothetical protein
MSRPFYILARDLHLYAGLFISPFVLVFATSVFFLVHAWVPARSSVPTLTTEASVVSLAPNLDQLTGRQRISALRPALDRMGVTGEVGFIQEFPKEHRLVAPVAVPGEEPTVNIDILTHKASIVHRSMGACGMPLLHSIRHRALTSRPSG